ncbi:MAG: hypothetical protein JOZ73_07380 [Solirubrobacterales bacterium]|nr:hypothetical protein [Solirubrobacterales bacterium]
MFQIAGGSIGLGLNTTVFSAQAETNLDSHIVPLGTKVSDHQSDLAHGILAGTKSATAVFDQFPPAVAHRIETLVREAFLTGLHAAFRMDAALALVGFFVALVFVGGTVEHQRLHEVGRWHHRSMPRVPRHRPAES